MSRVLQWWLVFSIMLLALGMFFYTGFYAVVLAKDITYISLFIIAALFGVTCSLGYNFYKSVKSGTPLKTNTYWFLADFFLTLGLIGTVLGFIIMFGYIDLTAVDPTNINGYRAMVSTVVAGLGTKLYTTLFGLIAERLLKIQLVIVEGWNDETESS